ncbi:MAG: hypothetical protein ACR2IF_16440 [Terriglobales bacterium]
MPAVIKIDRQRRLVCSTFYGELTDQELLRHHTALTADPLFDPTFSEIADFSAVTKVAVSEIALQSLAKRQSLYREAVIHVVVAPQEIAFQLAGKYQSMAQETRPNLVVVQTLEEAYQRLGVKP